MTEQRQETLPLIPLEWLTLESNGASFFGCPYCYTPQGYGAGMFNGHSEDECRRALAKALGETQMWLTRTMNGLRSI